MKTFLLITNTSGCTYWSYLGHRDNAPEFAPEIKKYGIIFINRNGGYFTADNIKTVHKAVLQDTFPQETVDTNIKTK